MMFHFMPLPVFGEFHLSNVLIACAWFLPMVMIYFWHTRHDHQHNRSIEEKLDAIIELLKKIAQGS